MLWRETDDENKAIVGEKKRLYVYEYICIRDVGVSGIYKAGVEWGSPPSGDESSVQMASRGC